MPEYGSFCPLAKAATVLSQRWTLLILRELMCGTSRFNDLERGLPGISRALLSKRLRTLVDCGIITTGEGHVRPTGYYLTQRGMELTPIVLGIGEWGQRWLNSGTMPDDIDTDLLMWDIHRRIDFERVGEGRLVVEFDFRGLSQRSYWLVCENGTASVCFDPPGFENDLMVDADTLTLHDVWLGRADLMMAMKRDSIRVHGPSALGRKFVQSLQYSLFAHVPFNGNDPGTLPGAPQPGEDVNSPTRKDATASAW